MENKDTKKVDFIKAFKHAVSAKEAFAEMACGKISKEEFENMGYKLAKLG